MNRKVNILMGVVLVFVFSVSLDLPSPPPPGEMGAYLNGAFPDTSPNSGWELEDPLPDFTFKNPLRLFDFPGTDDYLLLCKSGEIWRLSFENQARELVLDISDRTMDFSEAGSVGMALHPQFGDPAAPDKQLVFVFYRYKPYPEVYEHPGFNRLSKFSWDAQNNRFDPGSEEILIQQYDRNAWHNGGGMFFDNEGFLYLSLGDEGLLDDYPAHLELTTQRLDFGLFNGIIRIDVDNDPSRSHPILRQPQAPAEPPEGYGETFTQGYSIPNDNPWLSPDSTHLEEFYAIGIRSPYSFYFDKNTEVMWLADVGSDKREEISIVEKGDNLQWPYREGDGYSPAGVKPVNLIGEEKEPYWSFERSEGTCIIGGGVYRGDKFPTLYGRFLFGDWNTNKIKSISEPTGLDPEVPDVLIENINANDVDLPFAPGITGIFVMDNGEILVTVMNRQQYDTGKIVRLVRKLEVPQVLSKLSEVGAFTDLESLTPVPGLIPYRVNAPLWSDRAMKKRWMALANDGDFDSAEEKITFSESGNWDFPPGTVFVKHFELPTTTDPTGETARVETRFLVIDKTGNGYGLTYKWNDEGTEAFLQGNGSSKDFEITENGAVAFTQTWDYPSRDQCLSCHTDVANYVLGLKTHQLNGDLEYPGLNQSMNQLDYLNQYGIFNQEIRKGKEYPYSVAIDDESESLDLRIRSYLDANCSSCHQPGGVNLLEMDFRFKIPLPLQNMVNKTTMSHASVAQRLLVEPGSHATSEVWVRDASLAENRMPPIGRNRVDETYIKALAEWIDGLSKDAGTVKDPLVFPNPSSGLMNILVNENWTVPYQVRVYSTSGQLVQEEQAALNPIPLDMEDQPIGTYFIEISDGQNRGVQKFIKR